MKSLVLRRLKRVISVALLMGFAEVGPAAGMTNETDQPAVTVDTNRAETGRAAAAAVGGAAGKAEITPAPLPGTSEPTKVGRPEPAVTPSQAVRKRTALPATPGYYRHRPSREYSWRDDLSGSAKDLYDKVHDLMGDRFHVGISSMSYEFLDNHSRIGQGEENYFIGSIDELQDVGEDSAKNMTFGIYLTRNLGLEYRREEVRARTFTDSDNNHSDGDFVVEGSVISAVARLPLDQVLHGIHYVFNWPYEDEGWEYDLLARFVPYVGIGIKDNLSGSFDAATWWAHGYASPASWEQLGSPPDTIRNGHLRELRTTDDIGRYELYGMSVRLVDNFYFDINWSSVDAEIAVDFYLDGDYQASGTIPMDYETKTVGIRYFF